MKKNLIEVIGKSNTGKTRKILFEKVENDIKNNKNLFIIDDKQEYYNKFYEELKNNEYEIKVINFKEPLKSNGWDPIEYINYLYNNNKMDKSIEMTKNIGISLFPQVDTDPFWSQMSSDYFTGIVLSLIEATNELKKQEECTFTSIYNIINDGEKEIDDSTIMKKYVKRFDALNPIYIALAPTVFSSKETRESILSVVKQNLNNLFMRQELLKSFYNNEFKISQINKKIAIFVIGYKPINFLTNILLEQVYDYTISKNIDMSFVLDNFDLLSKINIIEEMINSSLDNKIDIYIGIRNEEKILDIYGKYTFGDIENVIRLNDIYESSEKESEKELPNLNNKKATYFDFEEYVRIEKKESLSSIDNKVIEANNLIQQNKLDMALEILENALSDKQIVNLRKGVDYSFRDIVEFYDYAEKYPENKDLVWINPYYSIIYKLLGYIESEKGNFKQALDYLNQGLEISPQNPEIYFEIAECYKMQKEYDKMFDVTKPIYDFIFRPDDLAQYYRLLGYYYTEKEKYELAYNLYKLSLIFEKNSAAYNEINYICSKCNSISIDNRINCDLIKNNNIPIGANERNIEKISKLINSKEINEKKQNIIYDLKHRLSIFLQIKNLDGNN